jgi:hypothetical protein
VFRVGSDFLNVEADDVARHDQAGTLLQLMVRDWGIAANVEVFVSLVSKSIANTHISYERLLVANKPGHDCSAYRNPVEPSLRHCHNQRRFL